MTELTLGGLDGSNPLAFFAALGVLNIVSETVGGDPVKDENGRVVRKRLASLSPGLKSLKQPPPDEDPPTLEWRDEGAWRPVVRSAVVDTERLIDLILEDRETWKSDPVRELRYDKSTSGKGKSKQAWDLKASPEDFRRFAEKIVKDATATHRRGADFLAAFATETATDNNGNTKPTALHFTAGQQEFLKQVDGLVTGVTADDIREALVGPWRYSRPLPVLGWDATNSRDYALRADDPSKDKKQGVPGADWLAFRGLSFFRVAARGDAILTTCAYGGWKDGFLRWPIWTVPIERATIQTLLSLPGLGAHEVRATPKPWTAATRTIRGVDAIFECALHRSEQGGYGSFAAPARI